MTIAPGTVLGPYEVTALLGVGGMSHVYRARDTRLGRDVAVKVLKGGHADPERLARFEIEAKALGAVSHPGLLAVYDVGSHDGAPYLVTEVLDGQTLRAQLAHGALPLRRIYEIAGQIAEALASAHAQGIVHRDLKPENVFLTRDGRVKVLDFGLARLAEATYPPAAEDDTMGRVFGTAGYMAPEQIRGERADGRADLFALGAILHEMATGRRVFQAPTAIETMNAVLNEEPPSLADLRVDVPPAFVRLVERCLDKAPERRFQSARDLAFALDGLDAATTSTNLPRLGRAVGSPRALVLVAILAALVGAAAHRLLPPRPDVSVPAFQRLTFRRGTIDTARFSPDGQAFVYGAYWDGGPVELLQGRLGSPESRSLSLPGADLLAVSSEGELLVSLDRRRVGTFVATGTLARVPLAGGAPRPVLEDVQEAEWGPGGDIAIVRTVDGRNRLEYPIGKVLFETAGWVSHPRFSPSGDRIAFVDHPVWGDDGGNVAVVDLGGNHRTLSRGWGSLQGLAWDPRRGEVWLSGTREGSSRGLWAVDERGRERPLLRVAGAMTLHDVRPDGRALVAHHVQRREMRGLAPGETDERELTWLDYGFPSDLSDDGATVFFAENGEGGGPGYSVYVRRLDGSPAVRLGAGAAMALSPDGQRVFANQDYTADAQRWMLLPTGTGAPTELNHGTLRAQAGTFLPDGSALLVVGNEPGRPARVWRVEPGGGLPRPAGPEGATFPIASRPVSPDGRSIVLRNADGSHSLYPLDGSAARRLTAIGPDDQAVRWSADGRGLYVYRPGQLPARVQRIDTLTGERTDIAELAPPDRAGVVAITPVLVSADGRGRVYGFRRVLSDLYVVSGL